MVPLRSLLCFDAILLDLREKFSETVALRLREHSEACDIVLFLLSSERSDTEGHTYRKTIEVHDLLANMPKTDVRKKASFYN